MYWKLPFFFTIWFQTSGLAAWKRGEPSGKDFRANQEDPRPKARVDGWLRQGANGLSDLGDRLAGTESLRIAPQTEREIRKN